VQKARLVPITTHPPETDHLHHIVRDPPVLNQEVHILQGPHPDPHLGPLQVLHLVLHLVLQVLQDAGDSLLQN
jgi:hypothetical protein